ncbi:MAG: alpha/beta fold hydrolase [Gemmatimonadetes bacterium]|nr:alpha/beta fold hydrolase [Gemmatimonadota bacterium]
MPTEKIQFEGVDGHLLSARIEAPPGPRPHTWALFAHCFTCTKNIRAAVDISKALAGRGVGVLRFDFTGLGESEGDFADTNFSSNVEDLVAAGRFMANELGAGPSILVGHSLGGAAVLQAAASLPAVRAVTTIGAPADPEHVLRHVEASAEEIEERGMAEVRIGGRPFNIKKQFLDDLRAQHVEEVVSGLDAALLFMHSPVDEIVGVDNAARLYRMAKHPKSFVSLDGADHLLADSADSAYVATVLAAWASRYVDLRDGPADIDELREADRAVTRTGKGTFHTDIAIRRHVLVADEPASVGGADAGPTPYDYLIAGLGACTSMTLQMYAGRKEWPLEEARVSLKHRRIHAKDCENCEEDPRLDVIDREIELVGPLDEEQRARLMEIADRCPVHRTLDAGVRVDTTEKG